jgi:hypothetical protein
VVVVGGGLVTVPVPVLVPVAVVVVLFTADGGHSIMNVVLLPVPAITVTVLLGLIVQVGGAVRVRVSVTPLM